MKVFEITNDPAEIETLMKEIVKYCHENDVDDAACFDVQLALDEMISNTIKYGYEDQGIHKIQVRVGVQNQKLLLEIEDDARAFNPLEAPAPNLSLPAEERPIGGLGIYLMRAVMDQIDYKRTGTKNILRMTRAVTSS